MQLIEVQKLMLFSLQNQLLFPCPNIRRTICQIAFPGVASNVTRFLTDCTDRACDIVGVLDALGIRQTHIVGTSIGAEVGLSLAAHHALRIRSLVAEGALHSEYGPYGIREPKSFEHDELLKLNLEERKTSLENRMIPKRRYCNTERSSTKNITSGIQRLNPYSSTVLSRTITGDRMCMAKIRERRLHENLLQLSFRG